MIDSSATLLLLLAALVAVPLLLRRYKAASPEGIRVVGRTALSKGAVVAVVAVGDRRLLVGAGERGVQLIAELDTEPAGGAATASTDPAEALLADLGAGAPTDHPEPAPASRLERLMPTLGRKDAAGTGTSPTAPDDALAALVGVGLQGSTTDGPGNGLVDRLRAMTVRTPVQGRPFHVSLRR